MPFTPDNTIQTKFRNVSFLCTNAIRSGGRKLSIDPTNKTSKATNTGASEGDRKVIGSLNTAEPSKAGVQDSTPANTQSTPKQKTKSNETTVPTYNFTVQDKGVEVPTFKLTALFHGPDYKTIRNELIKALDQGQPGELEFLGQGKFQVFVKSWRTAYVSTEFQYEKMNIEFVLFEPLGKPDKVVRDVYTVYVFEQAQKAKENLAVTTSLESFLLANESVTKKSGYSAAIVESASKMKKAISVIKNITSQVKAAYEAAIEAIDNIMADADNLVDSLFELNTEINNAVELIRSSVTSRIESYLSLLETSKTVGQNVLNFPGDLNEVLVNSLFRLNAILGATQDLDSFEFASVDDVETVKNQIFAELDDIAEQMADMPQFAEVYRNIVQVRAAVFKVLSVKLGALPNLITIEIKQPMPAEVLAYELYGDATRADEIIRRNNIPNSLFAQGLLTVLEN